VAAGPRYAANSDRRAHRAEIVAKIQGVLNQKPRDHWLAVFAKARVPAGPINRVDEVAADRELQRRGMFFNLAAEGRLLPQVGTGFHVDGQANGVRLAPPKLGASTADVLREIAGLSAEELEELRRGGEI